MNFHEKKLKFILEYYQQAWKMFNNKKTEDKNLVHCPFKHDGNVLS
jgi:hypothetical protein